MAKFKKGDEVVINKIGDNRRGYDNLYGRIGTIQFVKIYDGHATPEITYHVKVDGRKNPNQCDGWFVYDEEDLVGVARCDGIDTLEYYIKGTFGTDLCVPKTSINYCKKENKEMELLEIYFEEKQKQLEIKRDAKCDKIKLKDPIIRDLEALAKKYKDVKGLSIFANYEYQFSKEIYAELDKCEKDYKRQKGELIGLKKEIVAQLELCETYEQKQAILKAYGVVDEQGKLNK
jgi:hypothetical protein